MGLACTKAPRVDGEDGHAGQQMARLDAIHAANPSSANSLSHHSNQSFQPHYSIDDARSLHALSFTTSKNEEDSLVQELVHRSVSHAESDQDEAVNQLFQLIEAGIPLNTADENGETPIFAVARAGRLVMMEQLLSNGANAEVCNWQGNTPLHEAAAKGHDECVASLLEHSPSLGGVRNRDGETPLHVASAAGHERCVLQLLGADPMQYDIAVGVLNNEGLAPVHLAAKHGRCGVLEQLYDFEQAWRPGGSGACEGGNATMVTSKDGTGKTALIHAAIESDETIVQMLLMRGADPNARDAEGKTAEHFAVLSGAVPSLRSLLECGGDPSIKDDDGYTPFCYCAMSENPGPLEGFLAETLMYRAVETGEVEPVKAAVAQIEHCSKLDPIRLKDFGGGSPLHAASRRGVPGLLRFLVEAGRAEDLRARNDAGDLPVHIACRSGKVDCVDVLLSTDLTLGGEVTTSGDTCLHIAAKSGHTALITLLTATYHLSTQVRNLQENTPLHEAVCAMQYDSVKALLVAGADVLAKDATGATSLDLAGDRGLFKDPEIHRLLAAMAERGVLEDARGLASQVGDLIELSDDDMAMLEEMESMDVWRSGETRYEAESEAIAPLVATVATVATVQTAVTAMEDTVVQKTVRLPTPVAASPFGAIGDSSAGTARGFQKFACLARKTDNSVLESAKSSLYIEPENLEVFRNHVLGEGSFGVVYLGVLHGNKVAIKVFKRLQPSLSFKGDDRTAERQQFLDELEAMSDLRHDNIQAIRGYCVLPEGRAIVSAYYDRGSLVNILGKGTRNPVVANELTWSRRLRFTIDIVKALMAMHNRQPPRVHRDLKAANCFVDTNWNAYLGDFGFACTGDCGNGWNNNKSGPTNPRWLAPEVLLNASYSESSDIYAFGMLMFELLTWKPPYGRTGTAAIYNLVAAGVRPVVPSVEDLPGDPDDNRAFVESGAYGMYVNIMRSCWESSPSARIETNQLFGELATVVKAMEGTRVPL